MHITMKRTDIFWNVKMCLFPLYQTYSEDLCMLYLITITTEPADSRHNSEKLSEIHIPPTLKDLLLISVEQTFTCGLLTVDNTPHVLCISVLVV